MAMTIPSQQLPEVAPQTAPSPGFQIQATPEMFGATVGAAMQDTGRVLDQGADTMARQAIAQQELTNETLAKDAATTFDRQTIDLAFDPKTGFFSKMGKDAVDAEPDALDAAQNLRNQVLDTLPNARARLMADNVIVRKLGQLQESMAQHAQQQRKVWMTQSSDERIQATLQDGIAFYNDPARWGQAIATMKDEVLSQGEMNGWTPDIVAEKQRDTVSKAWTARIDRMAIDDPVAAQRLYRANMDQVSGAETIAVEKMLKATVTPVQTAGLATRIMGGGDRPAAPDTLFGAMEKQESGALANAVSAKGALGVMQLMPDTARDVAAKLNLPFDQDRLLHDDGYNRALGQEYMRQMLQRYGGDQTLALAAYNAGMGRVDNAIKVYGDPRAGQISDQDFIAKFPIKETRDYVATINAAAPPQAGAPPTSADVRAHLGDWMQQTREAATAMYPNDPAAVQQAVSHVETTAGQIIRGQAYAEKNAQNILMSKALGLSQLPDGSFTRAVIGKDGPPSTLDQLLADPQAKQAWATMDSIGQHGILTLLDHNAKGQSPPLTDDAWGKFYALQGQAARDPIGFQNVNLADPALLSVLPHAMTEKLMTLQASAATKQGRDLAKAENLDHALAIAKPSLLAIGVPTTAKAGTGQAATYDQFVGRLDEAVSSFVAQQKRAPQDDEIRKMVSGLLIQGSQAGAGWLGFSKSLRLFQSPDGTGFTPNVPDADRNAIGLAFKQRNGGRAPTDREISEWYMRGLSLSNGGGNGR